MKFTRRSPAPMPRRRQIDEPSRASNIRNNTFQRNRTISSVTPIDESSRSQAHVLAARRRRLWAIFSLVLLVLIAVTLLLAQFTAKVNVAVVLTGSQPQQAINTSIYAQSISAYLNDHPVERLRFALSSGQLMDYMETVHPEVASIKQVTNWGIGATDFTITFRQPVADWQINGQQYYVDSTGVAFQKNYFAAPTVQVIDQAASPVKPTEGATVASSELLSFIGKVVSYAKGRGYTITQAVLPAGTSREVVFHLSGVSEGIRMTINRGPAEQVEDMQWAITYLKAHGVTPQYIDVRIPRRAYYM